MNYNKCKGTLPSGGPIEGDALTCRYSKRRELEAEQREDMALSSPAVGSSAQLPATTNGVSHRAREAIRQGPRRRVSPAREGAHTQSRRFSPGRYDSADFRRSPSDAAFRGDSQALLRHGNDSTRLSSRPRGESANLGRKHSPAVSQSRGLSVPREPEQLNPRVLFRDGYELPNELLAHATAESRGRLAGLEGDVGIRQGIVRTGLVPTKAMPLLSPIGGPLEFTLWKEWSLLMDILASGARKDM